MKKESLLWKLECEGGTTSSYLFGTMHVRDRRAYQRLGRVYETIGECEGFAAEFHLEETGEGLASNFMQLAEGQRISDFFSKNEFQRYRRILLKTTGLDIALFDHMLPFLVVNLATESLLNQEMPEPLDQHLWAFAKSAGKTMHGIETFQEQMEVLQKISIEDQLQMLSGLCKNIGRFRHYLRRLAELYEKNEVQHLYKMVKKNSKSLRHLLIYHRNEVMAQRIAPLVKQRSLFVAIGAAHLGGGKGVLRLLKHQGIQLIPIEI